MRVNIGMGQSIQRSVDAESLPILDFATAQWETLDVTNSTEVTAIVCKGTPKTCVVEVTAEESCFVDISDDPQPDDGVGAFVLGGQTRHFGARPGDKVGVVAAV